MPDVHDTPETPSDARPHVLDRTCWCNPQVLAQTPDEDLIVHNAVAWLDD